GICCHSIPRRRSSDLIGTTNEDVFFAFFGGAKEAERKRAIIAPFYEEITDDVFEVNLLEGNFDSRFVNIKHRDILGAFTSLGIEDRKSTRLTPVTFRS